jgi:threonine dehydrogenase-like Zn-dependent dehydrogenase
MIDMKAYREGTLDLPSENKAWQLYGPGLESFGDDGSPATLPMPTYRADELLARIDAIGVCFSDVKLITQGNTHPRITGRDLVNEPVVPGHEVSLTIVGVGDGLKGKFAVGEKYVVQADVYYKGVNIAFGYALRGGMQQYVTLGEEVLRGDDGCYLIPVQPETGYAEAALAEPWACVVASYRIHPRRALKDGGNALVVGSGAGFDLPAGPRPKKVVLAGVGGSVDKSAFGGAEVIEIGSISADSLKSLSEERTGAKGFDDVIVLGKVDAELVEALDKYVARGGVLCIVSDEALNRAASIDVGRVHYDAVLYVGGKSVSEAYGSTRDSEFKAGGTAWFIGAAGPMGQMHVERAVLMKDGPSRILATDVDTARLETLRGKVAGPAKEKGIEIIFINPVEVGQGPVDEAEAKLTGGNGFDDIVVLAPVPALIQGACPHLGQGGVMNIFAGVPRGTMANMDVSSVYLKGTRFVGSSGSAPADLEFTLHEAESGNLLTNRSVAAIGGIDATWDGVEAVKKAVFPGKTVIFPQIADLPLVAVPDLKDVLPSVYDKLAEGQFWTREAEEELLKTKL